jgi:hypothetical protein
MIQVTLPRDDLADLDAILTTFQADSEEAPAGVGDQVTIYLPDERRGSVCCTPTCESRQRKQNG